MSEASGAPTVFAEYVKSMLAQESEHAASIQTRGSTVITVSTALVTLLASVMALATGKDRAQIPPEAQPWLIAALAAFLIACCLGVGTYAPRLQVVADPEATAAVLRSRWSDSEADALASVTADRLAWLQRIQRSNDARGRILMAAVIVQVVAVLCISVAVAVAVAL